MAGATVKSLQQRLEESKRSGKEKDALAARSKTRVRQLEEEAQKAHREADEKEARREREYKMLQDVSLRGLWENMIGTSRVPPEKHIISNLKPVFLQLSLLSFSI